jgi:hypothetical protein
MATLIGVDAIEAGGGVVAVRPWADDSQTMLLIGSAKPDAHEATYVDLTRGQARDLAQRLLDWANG